MDNLKKMYKNQCQLISNKADKLWKIGVIIISILFSLAYFLSHKFIRCVCIFTILFIIWFYMCVLIYDRELKIKVKNINNGIEIKGKNKYLKYEHLLDEYQKKIISDYTRKNRLNKLGKLNIIIDDLQSEINREGDIRNIFVIPSILAVFTSVINYSNESGLVVFIVQYFISILGAFWFIKSFYQLYDCKTFNKYTGVERLKELLLHVSIKHGR